MASESEVVRILRDLIRIDTTNPPGNERPAVDYIAGLLKKEGIDFAVVEPSPRRANLVARLKGDGSKPALLLSAHLDVVPALEGWRYPPFAAEIRDGYIWGRGAVDMKHMAAMSLVVLMELRRRKVRLSRDVVFAAVADEEAGGAWGAGYLVDREPELIGSQYCLTEVGGMTVTVNGRILIPVQVAQKGYVWFRMRARGPAGHGSRPGPGSAVEKLAAAVHHLSTRPLKYHLAPSAGRFLDAVASVQPRPIAAALKGLRSGRTAGLALRLLPREKREVFYAMLHNTAAVTGLSAGVKVNVVPDCAEATVDGRYLPGVNEEEFLGEVRSLVGPAIEIERLGGAPPLEMAPESELWDAIVRVMGRKVPQAKVAPSLITGMTDAKDYARMGIRTYGFAPVALKPDEPFASLYHAPNERISISGLETGLEWLYELVREFCAAP